MLASFPSISSYVFSPLIGKFSEGSQLCIFRTQLPGEDSANHCIKTWSPLPFILHHGSLFITFIVIIVTFNSLCTLLLNLPLDGWLHEGRTVCLRIVVTSAPTHNGWFMAAPSQGLLNKWNTCTCISGSWHWSHIRITCSVQFSHSVMSNSLWPTLVSNSWTAVRQASLSTQTHVHWVSNAIQPSHLLSSPSTPALNLSQDQGLFQWISSLHQVAKVLAFQLQHHSIQDWFLLWLTGLISLQSRGLSRVFTNTTVQKHQFFSAQLSL